MCFSPYITCFCSLLKLMADVYKTVCKQLSQPGNQSVSKKCENSYLECVNSPVKFCYVCEIPCKSLLKCQQNQGLPFTKHVFFAPSHFKSVSSGINYAVTKWSHFSATYFRCNYATGDNIKKLMYIPKFFLSPKLYFYELFLDKFEQEEGSNEKPFSGKI